MIAREIIEEYVLTYDFIDKLNSSNFNLTVLNNSDEELNKKIIFPKDAKLRQLILKHCRVNGKRLERRIQENDSTNMYRANKM